MVRRGLSADSSYGHQGFHLGFPAMGKIILYVSEHVISLMKEAQTLPRWEGSELGSQLSVEHVF